MAQKLKLYQIQISKKDSNESTLILLWAVDMQEARKVISMKFHDQGYLITEVPTASDWYRDMVGKTGGYYW